MTDSFPIQLPIHRRERIPGQPTEIPWAMIVPHEAQALRNHGQQDLKELARRKGLSPCEAVAVLEDRRWIPMSWQDATDHLNELLTEWSNQHE